MEKHKSAVSAQSQTTSSISNLCLITTSLRLKVFIKDTVRKCLNESWTQEPCCSVDSTLWYKTEEKGVVSLSVYLQDTHSHDASGMNQVACCTQSQTDRFEYIRFHVFPLCLLVALWNPFRCRRVWRSAVRSSRYIIRDTEVRGVRGEFPVMCRSDSYDSPVWWTWCSGQRGRRIPQRQRWFNEFFHERDRCSCWRPLCLFTEFR